MNEKDLEYLRNINTSPGPGAGRSIDPTKPGPSDAEPQENRLHRARRFIQAVKGDLRNATHISMLQTAINDIQAALAQSDAEPVAWRVKDYGDAWTLCCTQEEAFAEAKNGNRIEPLYTSPPRPDASAGLIFGAAIIREAME